MGVHKKTGKEFNPDYKMTAKEFNLEFDMDKNNISPAACKQAINDMLEHLEAHGDDTRRRERHRTRTAHGRIINRITKCEHDVRQANKIKEYTKALCPKCREPCDAYVSHNFEKVILTRTCEKHGEHSSVIEEDIELYERLCAPEYKKLEHDYSNLLLAVTSKCNLKCTYCYYPENKHDRSTEQVIALGKSRKFEQIRLTGGEPTVHPELLRIVEELSDTGAELVLLTNGTKLTDELLKQLKDKGLYGVHTTLSSTKTCKRIKDAGIKLSLGILNTQSDSWKKDMDKAMSVEPDEIRMRSACNLGIHPTGAKPVFMSGLLKRLSEYSGITINKLIAHSMGGYMNTISLTPKVLGLPLGVCLRSWMDPEQLDLGELFDYPTGAPPMTCDTLVPCYAAGGLSPRWYKKIGEL